MSETEISTGSLRRLLALRRSSNYALGWSAGAAWEGSRWAADQIRYPTPEQKSAGVVAILARWYYQERRTEACCKRIRARRLSTPERTAFWRRRTEIG